MDNLSPNIQPLSEGNGFQFVPSSNVVLLASKLLSFVNKFQQYLIVFILEEIVSNELPNSKI